MPPAQISTHRTLSDQPKKDLIVFSHLRWEFVTQRPQHIMNRLSKQYRIWFIEEPIGSQDRPFGSARYIEVNDNLTVLQPYIDSWKDEMTLFMRQTVLPLVNDKSPLLWFYSPSFIDATSFFKPTAIIYDCMDELSAFKNAPLILKDQEKELLKQADLVFTGGRSLYESKKQFHKNAHCFPSSVDQQHFASALSDSVEIPTELNTLPRPIVGFYGVIDERIDLKLLETIAALHPRHSFVMIGPVVKIDPAELPHLPNIHYLGQKNYAQLPQYLKGFDIAFMPFALNDSTRYISPTKTLEFMAAQKPIISSPINDVVADFKDSVFIAKNLVDWSTGLHLYAKETPLEKKTRLASQLKTLRRTSWDSTVRKMAQLIQQHGSSSKKYRQPTSRIAPTQSLFDVVSVAGVSI